MNTKEMLFWVNTKIPNQPDKGRLGMVTSWQVCDNYFTTTFLPLMI